MFIQRDSVVVQDIVNAAQQILDFVKGFNKDKFVADTKTRSAVPYQLTVMGEAVKRLFKEFREKHSQIHWSLIAGMLDHLIHAYDLVDWDEVWKTSNEDVPDLLDKIESYINIK